MTKEKLQELEESLGMPSFESELAQTDVPALVALETQKIARIVPCRVCGTQVLVGPGSIFKCPNSPHDTEDDLLTEDDLGDIAAYDDATDNMYDID